MKRLESGFLNDIYGKCFEHFLNGIDCTYHESIYIGEHPAGFAESEFAGKYMDICVQFYKHTKNEKLLEYAQRVAESVVKNQRADGYIGGYASGKEWTEFSVWNQAFTSMGLISVWEITQKEAYLAAAEKSTEYIAAHFVTDKADILDAPNYGSQHLVILIPAVRLYTLTGKPIYLEFAEHIVNRLKGSDNDFTNFESILELRSRKAIENFCALIGLQMYASLTDNEELMASVIKYADELAETQITETGNGTVGELWYKDGAAPRLLDAEQRPNENCVAVGWMELNYALFMHNNSAKYLDRIEKTLFNHLIGSLDGECTDFAYYQPNFGKRITRTAASAYKCCRYRGFSAVSYLPEYTFHESGDTVTAVLYTNASFDNGEFSVKEETRYPYDGEIRFILNGCGKLKLRIPSYCDGYLLTLDGKALKIPCENGFVLVSGEWTNSVLELRFEYGLKFKHAIIDGKARVAIHSGAALCVLVCQNEGEIFSSSIDIAQGLEKTETEDYGTEFVAHGKINGQAANLKIVDYASVGKSNVDEEYTVWIAHMYGK